MLHINVQHGEYMAPRTTTGLNTVTRRRPDGTVVSHYYDRKTGTPLGTDRESAIATARSGIMAESVVPLSGRLASGIYDHRLALGDAGEWLVRSELVASGLIVATPNSGARYDFAIDDGCRFWRMQVKTRLGGGHTACSFMLFSRGAGVKPEPMNYHLRGVDLFAFVNWHERAVIFRCAKEVGDARAVHIPTRLFRGLPSVADRWKAITEVINSGATAVALHNEVDAQHDQSWGL